MTVVLIDVLSPDSRSRIHAILTETPIPLCGNSSASFARKTIDSNSRFSNPLARPNAIFDIIGDVHDAATVYDGDCAKTWGRRRCGIA